MLSSRQDKFHYLCILMQYNSDIYKGETHFLGKSVTKPLKYHQFYWNDNLERVWIYKIFCNPTMKQIIFRSWRLCVCFFFFELPVMCVGVCVLGCYVIIFNPYVCARVLSLSKSCKALWVVSYVWKEQNK